MNDVRDYLLLVLFFIQCHYFNIVWLAHNLEHITYHEEYSKRYVVENMHVYNAIALSLAHESFYCSLYAYCSVNQSSAITQMH